MDPSIDMDNVVIAKSLDKIIDKVDSSDEDSSEVGVVNGGTDSSSTSGAHNGVNNHQEDDTDDEEDKDDKVIEKSDVGRFKNNGEPAFKPTKDDSDSSDTESESEKKGEGDDDSSDEDVKDVKKEVEVNSDLDVSDGCIATKIAEVESEEEDDDKPMVHEIYEPKEVVNEPETHEEHAEIIEEPSEHHDEIVERSPSPEPSKEPDHISHHEDEEFNDKENQFARSPSPEQRSPSPERKDSRGSSSYDEERASSLSPEPPRAITSPPAKLMSPTGPRAITSPTTPVLSSHLKDVTKIYTEALVTETNNGMTSPKIERQRPAQDITQIYTAKTETHNEINSKIERQKPTKDITQLYTAGMTKAEPTKVEPSKHTRPNKDITQLYTAAFNKEAETNGKGEPVKPKRNENITKMYTGGLGGKDTGKPAFRGKPTDEKTNPRKHNMSTSMDKKAIQEAYTEVLGDNNGVDWATFIFDGPSLGVTAKGTDFDKFKSCFGVDDRGFGYIRIKTGDEMSKRSKFILVTWVGPNVSVMKKAKMSTDKALIKEVIQNLSVELQLETLGEFSLEHFKTEVDKAGGANYGTGFRDL